MDLDIFSEADQDRLRFFGQHYAFPVNYVLTVGEKEYLGNEEERKCRFCGGGDPDVSFLKTAHAISECLGNKSLFSYYECDTCNQNFGDFLEDHLAKYVNPINMMCQVIGKRGIPSYKTKSKKSRVDVEADGVKVTAYEDDDMIEIDEENKLVTLKFRRQTHVPIAVLKALTKSALTLMPEEELQYFDKALKWICSFDHENDPFVFRPIDMLWSFTPGRLPWGHSIIAMLGIRRSDDSQVPYSVFVICFGNCIYQVFLPLCSRDEHLHEQEVEVKHWPSPVGKNWPYGKPSYQTADLSCRTAVKDDPVNIAMQDADMILRDNNRDTQP